MPTYKNPILPGFYPDPSICRVNDDFYLVTSTFVYFPGVPIFHSKDLVHWEQIGNVLTRKSQADLLDTQFNDGIYAPTLRYHNGLFYMITTNVRKCGNFYVTAKKPEGPWSDPMVLDAEGIDPTLFFDDDGKVYYLGTREKPQERSKYYGDNEIWLQEVDLEKGKLIGEKYVLWEGALVNAIWPEGPHLYKKDGYYYLMISEGGTDYHHAITIARSKNLFGGYEGNPANPILTHRHLGKDYPITNVGHGDLVELQDGSWWMVLLGSRPYGGRYRNLGRETFLVPVEWEEGWPIVNKGRGIVEREHAAPSLPYFFVNPPRACEHFDDPKLDKQWMFLRNPNREHYNLLERPSYLRMTLSQETLMGKNSPSFLGRRQTDMNYTVSAFMEFAPQNENEVAGLVLIQNEDYHFRYEKTLEQGENILRLVKREAGKDTVLAKARCEQVGIYLTIVAKQQELYFLFGNTAKCSIVLASAIDARILSVDVAGGFVGTCIGMYASSNGAESTNYADFDWFEYVGSDN